MTSPHWATSRLTVRAESNTSQLQKFLDKHGNEVPDFAAEFPVGYFDDATLEAAWGCASLPQALSPRKVHLASVTYTFKTAASPPIKWVTRVAKRYEGLSFRLAYVVPSVVLLGDVEIHGSVRRSYECEGDQRDVEQFLLMVG